MAYEVIGNNTDIEIPHSVYRQTDCVNESSWSMILTLIQAMN